MAILTEKRGRPRYIADISLAQDPAKPYYDQFNRACRDFTYRDIIALARWFGISPRTPYRWKHGEKYPRLDKMLTVLEWTAAGKPIKLETQAQIAHKSSLL